MRDGCGHLRHTQSVGELREVLLRQHQALLGTALFLDIDVYAIPAIDFAFGRALRDASDEEPSVDTIGCANARFDFKLGSASECGFPISPKQGLVFRMKDFEERTVAQLLRRD